LFQQLTKLHEFAIAGEEGGEEVDFPFIKAFGEVLDLKNLHESKILHNQDLLFSSTKVYARDVFCGIWRELFTIAEEGWLKMSPLLQGAPGTGKSLLAFLFCYFYSRYKKIDIHYLRRIGRGLSIYYKLGGLSPIHVRYYGEVLVEQMQKRWMNSKYTIVCDGFTQSTLPQVAISFAISSVHWRLSDEAQLGYRVLVMPPWVWESLQAAADKGIFGDASEAELSQRYYYVGGCIRHMIESLNNCRAWAELVAADIKHSPNSSVYLSNEGSDRVSRMFAVLPNFTKGEIIVDAPFLLECVVRTFELKQFENMLTFGRHYGGSLHGIMFEHFIHKTVYEKKCLHMTDRKGQNYTFENLQYVCIPKKNNRQLGNETDHIVSTLSTLDPNSYWCVELSNLSTVDCGVATYGAAAQSVLLQVTIADTHAFDIKVAERLLRTSQAEGKGLFLFVVDDSNRSTFKIPDDCKTTAAEETFDFAVVHLKEPPTGSHAYLRNSPVQQLHPNKKPKLNQEM
jgi:hypothetical protein